MKPKPSLCLNMIVRNEAARIDRCLLSVLPYVKSVVILDTGSTDDTLVHIKRQCDDHKVQYAVFLGEFKNFSQARNEAFRRAKMMNGKGDHPWCQFALLVDADMELVVDDKTAFDCLTAGAQSYDMRQKGGAVSYANRRIVNLAVKNDPYIGVTHEYLDLPAAGMIEGASFIDHADGSNRSNKYERDAALLEEALKTEPSNGRYWYYLGNTYRDWGKPEQAASAYGQRIHLGGWDEETHSAMMNLACCYKDMGEEQQFAGSMVEAFNFRPQRAEPLYDLAKHYREKGNNASALLFAKAGCNLPRPNDLLFVNDFVYSHGLRYEYSIAGFYDEKERDRAFEITDDLALDPKCPADIRWSARNNLYWHTKPLTHYCPSFRDKQLGFTPPEGYTATNPSIEECNGRIKCNIRCVNYTIDEHGQYIISDGGQAIDTRNFLCTLGTDLAVHAAREIVWSRVEPQYELVTGLEDIRLWRYRGELNFSATVRELNPSGLCQIIRGRLLTRDEMVIVGDTQIISGGPDHQKNWMPVPAAPYGEPRWMYRLDRIVEPDAPLHPVVIHAVPMYVSDISGSSQLVPFKNGYLAVTHEAATGPDDRRTYWHRFAWFEMDGRLRRLSLPFVFLDRQIEFCAGLAYHPNRKDLMISFGVRDAEAHVATVSVEEVARMCWKFHES